MILTRVYMVYTTRKQYRARFICLVGARYIAFRRDRNRSMGVDKDGSASWASERLTRRPLRRPLTLISGDAIVFSGGRILAS